MLENMESSVILAMNKRYFVEDKYLLVDCIYNPKVSPPYQIALHLNYIIPFIPNAYR